VLSSDRIIRRAVAVLVVEVERGLHLGVAVPAAQHREARAQLGEVDHAVAVRVEQVEERGQDIPRHRWAVGRLGDDAEARVERVAVQREAGGGARARGGALEHADHLVRVEAAEARHVAQRLERRQRAARRRGGGRRRGRRRVRPHELVPGAPKIVEDTKVPTRA